MTPGYWLVRVGRNTPWVPARLWFDDAEPGVPENKLDRSRSHYPRAMIGLDEVPPEELWAIVAFCEATPEEREALVNPPLSQRQPSGNRARAFTSAPLAKWKQDRAIRIDYLAHRAAIALWSTCGFDYRKPIEAGQFAVPNFKEL